MHNQSHAIYGTLLIGLFLCAGAMAFACSGHPIVIGTECRVEQTKDFLLFGDWDCDHVLTSLSS